MKRNLLLLIVLCCTMTMLAQNGKISYQAVVRDSENHLVYDTPLQVTVSLANSETGTAVYSEQHAVTSNANGLISLLIGDGQNKQGHWEDVQWSTAWVTATIRKASDQTFLAEHHLPLSAVPYALYADEVDTSFLQNYLTTHDYGNDDYVTQEQLNDTLGDYLTINGLCDSIATCAVITNLQTADSLLNDRITRDSIALSEKIHSDSTYLKGLIDSCSTIITNNTTNITNNTTNISNITNHITQLQASDSVLSARFAKDSIALSKRLDTLFTHLCDSIEQCEVITNLQNADSLLGVRITRDSILSYKADSILSARITADSTNLANNYYNKIIINDTVGYILGQITNTTGDLNNNYYTKPEINDTLGHYTTSDSIDSLLGNYATKDTLKNYLTIDGLCDSIKKCEVITNLQNADSALSARITADSIRSYKADSILSTRIINDSLLFYRTDSVLLAHILNDSIMSHQVDSILLARILSDSTNLANNYYNKDKIDDTLSYYTTTDQINNMLGNYATKDTLKNYLTIDGLCDSIKKCEVITNLQNADSVLGARITADSIRSYKADSALSARIKADSTNLANNYYNKIKINDTVAYILRQITSTSGSLSNDYYTKEEINDTLGHYTTSNSIDSLLRNYAKKDTLKNYLTIEGLCDSIKNCNVLTSLQSHVTNNTTNITNNTTNITKNTTNINNLQVADSVLNARFTKDSIALSKRMDTLLTHICDSIEKCDIISNLQKSDSLLNVRITNDSIVFYKADSVLSARLIDTASKIRLALKDSLSRYLDSAQVRKEIHDSIGNGTLTITYGDNTPVTFTANQKTPSSIVIPSSEAPVYGTLILQKNGTNIDEFTANTDKTINIEVPTKLSQLANDGGTYAKRDSVNVFTAANNFTGGSITVPSNGTDIPRPADSDPTSCNNNNAVAVCDLLAVFDSLSNRIKKLEDELAAMNQPTSAVSVSLSEITRTSLKATATMNNPNLNVTSYEICISESASMSDSTCQTISTTNEYTFTGLNPNTVYYVTAKAYHNSGTAISDVASGKTLPLTLDISISPASPVCLCDGNPTTVTYTANIDDADLDKYDFSWSVPDGPTPENSDERICTINYSVSASYKVTCTATLKANTAVQLTADTTITVQNCTTPTITTCETDSTVTVKSVTGNPDFIDWNDGHIGNSVSENSTHTYSNPGAYEIEVSQDGCSYKHKVAMGEAALYPCSVSSAHTDPTEYTGTSSASPGSGGLETTDSEGKVTHVADQDGNIYPVVQIGSQCWMAKNLRTTHFSNGVEMALTQMMPNYQYDDSVDIPYRYAPALGMDYLSSWGYYYNRKAAMYEGTNTNNQGVCPKGWHLPSKEEWETMATVVNGSEVVFPYSNEVRLGTLAGKLSMGCAWKVIYSKNTPYPGQEGAPGDYNNPERNVSGFSSIPAGWVSDIPGWVENGTYAYYWSSTLKPFSSDSAYALFWNHNYTGISCVPLKGRYTATSVRCLRNETALTSYPTLSVTPSTTSLLLCPGSSENVTYTAEVVVNGVPTNDYSYTWKVTNTKTNTTETLSDHSSQVTIPYSDSANYKVSCVANSNTTADSATNSVMTLVRLKVAPSFTIQDPSGFTVTLNNITNTNQIVWDNNHANTTTDILSVNQTSATHTYGAAGSYQITAYYSASNCSLTQTVGIQVSVVLTSSNNTAFCPDSSTTVTYTATVDGATASEYSWEVTSGDAGGFTPAEGSGNQFNVTYNATGTYTVSCTATLVGGGSLGKATTTTITANEAPAFSPCVDGKWLTVSGMSNVATIHWTLSGTGESVDTDDPLRSHNYDDNESDYSIKVLSSAGCEATASGDLGTTPSTYCRVQTGGQPNENEEYEGDKLLRVKDNAVNETNWYSVVQIGSQCWMAENLRTNSGGWQDPRYNNSYYRSKFGRLYNRDSAKSSCPTGWHLPSLAEWEQMESVVSGSTISHSSTNYVGTHAGLLAGVCDWTSSDVTSSPGNHAQNTYGFRVLPAGNRNISSNSSVVDYDLGDYASFWCSDEGGVAWTMKFDEAGTMKESVPTSLYYISVRCVRDEAAVLPTPTMSITPNDENVSFCPENSQNVSYTASLTLDNQPVACNSYVWSVTSSDAVGFTAIQQNTQTSSFEMTYSIPGHYTVSCTATPSGYNSANASVSTTVTHKAAPSFTVSKAGRTVTLGSLQHVNTISWFENDDPHGTETNPYTYNQDETYKITVYSEDNCSIDTNVTVNALPVQTSVPEISGITANSMTVTPHFSGTIASYTYCYSTNNDMSGAYCSEAVTETSHNFMGLTPNTTYYVQVTATNAGGSTNSTIVSAQTLSSSGGDNVSSEVNKMLSCVIRKQDNKLESSAVTSLSGLTNWESGREKGRQDDTYIVVDSIRDDDDEVHWYKVVQIGSQCWMKENMRAKKYDGSTNALIYQTSSNLSENSRCYYYPNDKLDSVKNYGLLYNWMAATNDSSAIGTTVVRGICPAGWHVPTDAEWNAMENFVNNSTTLGSNSWRGTHARKLATCDSLWKSSTITDAPGNPSGSNRNASGFSALPAGGYYTGYNSFEIGSRAVFYTSTVESDKPYIRLLQNSKASVWAGTYSNYTKSTAISVRCVRDTVPAEQQGGGGEQETPPINRKISCALTGSDTNITTSHDSLHTEKNINNQEIEKGHSYNNGIIVLDSVSDWEGHWYEVVQIGTQCWLKENMRARRYSSGNHYQLELKSNKPSDNATFSIPNRYCWAPSLNSSNTSTYGLYYNWGAVMNISTSTNPTQTEGLQGICPIGWHVPSLSEWNTMMTFVDNYYDPDNNNGSITGILSSSSSNYWQQYQTTSPAPQSANYPYLNASGFSALPAGAYVNNGGNVSGPFFGKSGRAQFWTSTLYNDDNSGICLYWTYSSTQVTTLHSSVGYFYSAAAPVRCVRD